MFQKKKKKIYVVQLTNQAHHDFKPKLVQTVYTKPLVHRNEPPSAIFVEGVFPHGLDALFE